METKDEFQYILTPYKRTLYFAVEIYFYYLIYSLLFIYRGHIYSELLMFLFWVAVTLLILKQLNIYKIVVDKQGIAFKKALGKDFSIEYKNIQKIGFENTGDSRLRSVTIYLYSYDRIYEHKISRYDIDHLIEILSVKCIEYSIELDTKDLEPIVTSWLIKKLKQLWGNQRIK